MLAQEAGDRMAARESAAQLRISESEIAVLWWQAMKWARQVSSGVRGPPREKTEPSLVAPPSKE
jgi:hypothetical protein